MWKQTLQELGKVTAAGPRVPRNRRMKGFGEGVKVDEIVYSVQNRCTVWADSIN